VTVAVVDSLKTIHVDHHQRDRGIVAFSELLRQELLETAAVGE
jgi:hypothetical protein